jgi:hypothetical protein
MNMVDYSKEKFQVGDYVKFDIWGSNIRGTGRILGKGLGGLAPMWIILIDERPTDEMKNLVEKAILVQENVIEKTKKGVFVFR